MYFIKNNTVKLVYNGHSWDPKKWPLLRGWPLFRGWSKILGKVIVGLVRQWIWAGIGRLIE
jgi:hypothetical protein